MKLTTESYWDQVARWPKTGRHILAQFNDKSIVVYQAFRPSIGEFAAVHGYFGGEFNFHRMSWIKPNFLWMMYRSGWGGKEGQQVILAVSLKRTAFDAILEQAVHSTFVSEVYHERSVWENSVRRSLVRLQWDPDHDPSGRKVERRALQLGLRGAALARYAREWIVDIEDISEFVREQYPNAGTKSYEGLLIPRETVYPVRNPEVASRLCLPSVEIAGPDRVEE